jgi:signal peptidase I
MGVLFLMVLVRLVVHLKPSILSDLAPETRGRYLEGWDSIVGALLGALLLVKFVVRPFYIPSGSMEPTFLINDRILVNSFMYNFTDPNRGDIVVFFPPPETASEEGIILIKRVVAVAHDRVEVRDGQLILNDEPLVEPFIKERIEGDFGPITVEEGHVFCMGDNRNNSRDSRFIGQIPLKNILGRAECIFFPPQRMRLFNFPHTFRSDSADNPQAVVPASVATPLATPLPPPLATPAVR